VGDLVYTVQNDQIRPVPLIRVQRVQAIDHSVLRIGFARGAVFEISAGHPTADGRTLADLKPGMELLGEVVQSVERIPYGHAHTHDILPDSDTGSYFAAGVLLGSTLSRP
jgi:hypothetical protein